MPYSWDREYDFNGSSRPVYVIPQALVGPEDDDETDENIYGDEDELETYGVDFDDNDFDDDDFDDESLVDPADEDDGYGDDALGVFVVFSLNW